MGYRLQVTGYRLMAALFSFFLFVLLSTVHCTLNPTFAADEFSTTYDVTYDVGTDGITTVTEKINLKNLTSQFYATQFSLTIGATQISDVSASDQQGPLDVQTQLKGNSTTLSVKFNQQVAGQDKVLPWTLTFKSKDFATPEGKVWELSVPKVVPSTTLESYNLTVSVPDSFGDPTAISPTPKSSTRNFGKIFLTFDKTQLTSSGVSASFGNNQLFDFDLTYHLENSNIFPLLENVALPPDTAYQDVTFSRIDPKPLNVTLDQDGNYLAWFRLTRGEKLDVKVIGSAKLYSNSKVQNPTLDPALYKIYTQSDKYWEKDHPQIKAKLAEILGKNPPNNTFEKAKLIHRYVANYLKYDANRINSSNTERLGAVTALNYPNNAVCMEYTDLFIALARAAGIPARELDGFAYTTNSALRPLSLARDILHAWPEFYDDKRGWVMIDPTWESTTGGVDYFDKLDLNHFVFAVKGTSSETPAPAGSYKYQNQDTRDVKVQFSNNDFLGKPQLIVDVQADDPIVAGFPGKLKVKIFNMGNALQQSATLGIMASKLNISNNQTQMTGPIPPFGNAEFDYDIKSQSVIDDYLDEVNVHIDNQQFEKTVHIKPFIIFQNFPITLILLVGGIAIIYFMVLGGFIYRRKILKKPVAKK